MPHYDEDSNSAFRETIWINVDSRWAQLQRQRVYAADAALRNELERWLQVQISSNNFSNFKRRLSPDYMRVGLCGLLSVDCWDDFSLDPDEFNEKYAYAGAAAGPWEVAKRDSVLISLDCFGVTRLRAPSGLGAATRVTRAIWPIAAEPPPARTTRLTAGHAEYKLSIDVAELTKRHWIEALQLPNAKQKPHKRAIYYLVVQEEVGQQLPVCLEPSGFISAPPDGVSFTKIGPRLDLDKHTAIDLRIKTDEQTTSANLYLICSAEGFPEDVVEDLSSSLTLWSKDPRRYPSRSASVFEGLGKYLTQELAPGAWKVFRRPLEFAFE